MISKGNIGIIDWQGARLGPLGYDLASLLIDPYSNLSSQNKASLYERYLLMIKENNVERSRKQSKPLCRGWGGHIISGVAIIYTGNRGNSQTFKSASYDKHVRGRKDPLDDK